MDGKNGAESLVGGISSFGRILPPLDSKALKISHSKGPYLWDETGRRHIDTVMGFGATILGHAPENVVKAVVEAVAAGPMPGFSHQLEADAAAALVSKTGELTRALFLNSGSEAVQFACRIARIKTGKQVIAKFAGAFNGWHDGYRFGMAGTLEAAMADKNRPVCGNTVLIRYNDPDDIDKLFSERNDIAAILVEPVLANAGSITPALGYLEHLQEVARSHGAMVISDEVLMGFRLHNGLFAHLLGLEPDLATVGKAIGSGFSVAAVIGTPEAMRVVSEKLVPPAGTYNGNPVAAAAVLATAEELKSVDYEDIERMGGALRSRLEKDAAAEGIVISTSGYGPVFSIWFSSEAPGNYSEALKVMRPELSLKLHLELRRKRVITIPGHFGRLYMSAAHDEKIIDEISSAMQSAFNSLVKGEKV